MKLHRKNRSRSYYRYHRNRVIQRKLKIAERLGWHVSYAGRFAKGKVHCSCWMCSQKTGRNGYPHGQVMQWERLSSQLSDYLDGNET